MEWYYGVLILGALVHLLVSLGALICSADNGDDPNARLAARYIFATPVWPIVWVIWILVGLWELWKYAWEMDADDLRTQ